MKVQKQVIDRYKVYCTRDEWEKYLSEIKGGYYITIEPFKDDDGTPLLSVTVERLCYSQNGYSLAEAGFYKPIRVDGVLVGGFGANDELMALRDEIEELKYRLENNND